MSKPLAERIQAFRTGRISLENLLLHLMRRRFQVPMDGLRPHVETAPDGAHYIVAISNPQEVAETETTQGFFGFELPALARQEQAGISFDLHADHATHLTHQQLEALDEPASIARIEYGIQHPSPGEGARFLRQSWFTFVRDGRVVPHLFKGKSLIGLYTTGATAGATAAMLRSDAAVQRIDGPMLFRGIEELEVDGLGFHAGQDNQVLEGRPMIRAIAQGQDYRPGAIEPTCRSVAEAHALVEQLGATIVRQELVETEAGMRAQYFVERNGYPFLMRFEPPPAQDDEFHLGEGTTQVLCAGFLMQRARQWVIAAMMDGERTPLIERRLRMAEAFVEELLRQHYVGGIGPQRMRTVAGFELLRKQPQMFELGELHKLQQEINELLESGA